jgi:YHS domain-containing protein
MQMRYRSVAGRRIILLPTYDVACGKQVGEERAELDNRTLSYRRTSFHFCSFSCKDRFSDDPMAYIYPYHRRGQRCRS